LGRSPCAGIQIALGSWEDDGTIVRAADGKEFRFLRGGFADGEPKVEGRDAEFGVAEGVKWAKTRALGTARSSGSTCGYREFWGIAKDEVGG
jgi:hypothetical protein